MKFNYRYLTLALLSSFCFSVAHAEDEIEDLSRAKNCFSLEADEAKVNEEINNLNNQIIQKQNENNAWKKQLDKDLKAMNSQDKIDESVSQKWIAENRRYQETVEKPIKAWKKEIYLKDEQLSTIHASRQKQNCSGHFSEEAVEKICIIDKKFPLSCNRLLNGEMKSLKE